MCNRSSHQLKALEVPQRGSARGTHCRKSGKGEDIGNKEPNLLKPGAGLGNPLSSVTFRTQAGPCLLLTLPRPRSQPFSAFPRFSSCGPDSTRPKADQRVGGGESAMTKEHDEQTWTSACFLATTGTCNQVRTPAPSPKYYGVAKWEPTSRLVLPPPAVASVKLGEAHVKRGHLALPSAASIPILCLFLNKSSAKFRLLLSLSLPPP